MAVVTLFLLTLLSWFVLTRPSRPLGCAISTEVQPLRRVVPMRRVIALDYHAERRRSLFGDPSRSALYCIPTAAHVLCLFALRQQDHYLQQGHHFVILHWLLWAAALVTSFRVISVEPFVDAPWHSRACIVWSWFWFVVLGYPLALMGCFVLVVQPD
jgi:hypothetical protein